MHQLHTLFCIWHMCVSGRMPENFIRIDREYSEWQVFLAGGRGDKSNFSVLTGQYCTAHTLGWSDFERKKCYTLYVVPNGCRTSIPKFHDFMLHFHLSQGLRKFWVLPKMNKKKFYFFIFKGCTWNKICSLACLKTKTEEKGQNNFFLLFFRSKTVLAIFGKL